MVSVVSAVVSNNATVILMFPICVRVSRSIADTRLLFTIAQATTHSHYCWLRRCCCCCCCCCSGATTCALDSYSPVCHCAHDGRLHVLCHTYWLPNQPEYVKNTSTPHTHAPRLLTPHTHTPLLCTTPTTSGNGTWTLQVYRLCQDWAPTAGNRPGCSCCNP